MLTEKMNEELLRHVRLNRHELGLNAAKQDGLATMRRDRQAALKELLDQGEADLMKVVWLTAEIALLS